MAYALEIESIQKNYPGFSLEDVTLKLERGTIMGLIGENGAGKTTTLKVLLGLIQPNGGSVSLLGETAPDAMQRAKSRVGVVLDEGFFPDIFKAREVERVCRNLFPNWERDTFAGYMRKFTLPENKKIKEFSKGMRMKLAIAVALSHAPELLILDEVTGGLDPVIRSDILDVFLDFIQDERHAILFSTHVTTDLERVADSITFLHKGRVVLQQEKDEILQSFGVLKCSEPVFHSLDKQDYVGYRKGAYGLEVLLTDRGGYLRRHPDAIVDRATLDDIMLYTIRGANSEISRHKGIPQGIPTAKGEC